MSDVSLDELNCIKRDYFSLHIHFKITQQEEDKTTKNIPSKVSITGIMQKGFYVLLA